MGDSEPPTVTVDDLRTRGFTDAIIDELVKGSAISPAILVAFGVGIITDAKEAAKRFGWRRQDWEDGRLPAWTVDAYIPFHRDPVLSRAKPARPFEIKQRDGSVQFAKYAQPKSSGVHVFYGVSLRTTEALTDVSIPILLTEGEKKCMAGESAGLCCLALFGVNQWHLKGERTLHPELAHIKWYGRKVYLGFDRDASTNYRVRKEELALARAVEAAGAIVRIVRFPEDAPKLDDFLATHDRKELAELLADADKHGLVPPDTTAPDEAWKPVFEHLRLDVTSGRPVKDVDNVVRILKHHPLWAGVLGYDVRGQRQLFLREPPVLPDVAVKAGSFPREITDSDVARVADWFSRQTCLAWKTQPTTAQTGQAILMASEQTRIDTVRDYLVGLVWDGVPRLDRMAVVYFGTDDTEYNRTVTAKWMLSAVARVRQPGCQVDHALILEGEQGLRKSTALRILAGDAHFSDSLPHDLTSKDAKEHLNGPWIIELAELAALKRAELEGIKSFITCRTDRFRPAYGRRTVAHPRRCAFAGTTNNSEYLRDGTGNRRFWPIKCTRIDLDALARDRDQLWAEALHRVRAGEPWHVTDEQLAETIADEQAARREVDPWYEVVREFVSTKRVATIIEVLEHLGEGPEDLGYERRKARKLQFDQRAANRVSAILTELKWVRKRARIGATRVWRYEAPPAVPTPKREWDQTGDTPSTRVHSVGPTVPTVPGASHQTNRPGEGYVYTGPSCAPSPDLQESSSRSSGDSGDSGTNVEIPRPYGVPTLAPVSDPSGTRPGDAPPDTPPDSASAPPDSPPDDDDEGEWF